MPLYMLVFQLITFLGYFEYDVDLKLGLGYIL